MAGYYGENQASASCIGGLQDAAKAVQSPKPALDELESRIRVCQERASQTATTLARHADAVFGPVPECESAQGNGLYDDSAMGRINSVLHELEATLDALVEQANRNCKLA